MRSAQKIFRVCVIMAVAIIACITVAYAATAGGMTMLGDGSYSPVAPDLLIQCLDDESHGNKTVELQYVMQSLEEYLPKVEGPNGVMVPDDSFNGFAQAYKTAIASGNWLSKYYRLEVVDGLDYGKLFENLEWVESGDYQNSLTIKPDGISLLVENYNYYNSKNHPEYPTHSLLDSTAGALAEHNCTADSNTLAYYSNLIYGAEPATCTKDGKQISWCTQCGKRYETVIPKTGHEIVTVVNLPATCEEQGLRISFCANPWCDEKEECGTIYEPKVEVLDAMGHNFSFNADCAPGVQMFHYHFGSGLQQYVAPCSHCGLLDVRTVTESDKYGFNVCSLCAGSGNGENNWSNFTIEDAEELMGDESNWIGGKIGYHPSSSYSLRETPVMPVDEADIVDDANIEDGENTGDDVNIEDGENTGDDKNVEDGENSGDNANVEDGENTGDNANVEDGENSGDNANVEDGGNTEDNANVEDGENAGDNANVEDGGNTEDNANVEDGENAGDNANVEDGGNTGDNANVEDGENTGDGKNGEDGGNTEDDTDVEDASENSSDTMTANHVSSFESYASDNKDFDPFTVDRDKLNATFAAIDEYLNENAKDQRVLDAWKKSKNPSYYYDGYYGMTDNTLYRIKSDTKHKDSPQLDSGKYWISDNGAALYGYDSPSSAKAAQWVFYKTDESGNKIAMGESYGGPSIEVDVISEGYKVSWYDADTGNLLKPSDVRQVKLSAEQTKAEVSVTDDDKKPLTVNGNTYQFVDDDRNVLTEIAEWGKDTVELKLYFRNTTAPVPEAATYTVRWLELGTDKVLKEAEVRGDVAIGETANATDKDKVIDGYTLAEAESTLSAVVTKDNSTVITLYFNQNKDATYTVRWLELGTDKALKEAVIRGDVDIGETAYAAESDKVIDGYTFKEAESTLSVVVAEDNSAVITLYFTKNETPSKPDNPDNPSKPDNPGGNPGGSGGGTPSTPVDPVEVPEPEVPLAEPPEVEIPEPDVPLADVPDEVEIPDSDVPLSDVPTTGDKAGLWSLLSLLSAAGLMLLKLIDSRRRKEE